MWCPACAAENGDGARFCSGCGQRMPERAAGPSSVSRVMMVTCHRCGETLPPDSYFSRGLNVAKLVALLPITFILPILFFFLRKDRMVCGNCRRLLPASAPTALLPAFQADASGALVPTMATGSALALTSPQSQQMEAASRSAKARGIFLSIAAMPLSLPVVAFVGDMGWAELSVVGLPGALVMTAAVTSLRRASRLQRRARETEAKHLRQKVLSLAQYHKGRLSVSQVAASLGFDFAEAEQVLDGMVDGRHVDVEVTDDGRMVYVFPDLMS